MIGQVLRRLIPLAGFAAVVAVVVVTSDTGIDGDRSTIETITSITQKTIEGECDRDSLDVGYQPAGDDAIDVVVSDIDWPACSAAELRVALTVQAPDTDRASDIVEGSLALSDSSGSHPVAVDGDTATATLRVALPEGLDAHHIEVTRVAVHLERNGDSSRSPWG
jgi:hypothetical protein